MGELLTILAIAFALEYLLGWAFDRKPDRWADSRRDWEEQYVVETELVNGCLVCNASPGEDCRDGCPVGSRNYKPRRYSPVMSIQEILPRVPGQRNFRVIAAPGASPIELKPYMPFDYGESLPDAQVVTGIEYEREHLTKSHATWEVRYTLSPPHGFTSSNYEMHPVDVDTMKRMKESIQQGRAEAYYRDKFHGSPIANERDKRLNQHD